MKGGRGERCLPHSPDPTGQKKELRLPLTELQSWGQGGDVELGLSLRGVKSLLLLCLESQSP